MPVTFYSAGTFPDKGLLGLLYLLSTMNENVRINPSFAADGGGLPRISDQPLAMEYELVSICQGFLNTLSASTLGSGDPYPRSGPDDGCGRKSMVLDRLNGMVRVDDNPKPAFQ